MGKISDEIREFADAYENRDLQPALNGRLHAIAERIDSELVELPRIPRTLDNGIAQDWLEYTDEPWGLVHMGDVVDMYPDELQYDMNVRNVKHSGEVSSAVYERNGELSMILLLDKRAGEQWVDYTGAVYHHKEDSNE